MFSTGRNNTLGDEAGEEWWASPVVKIQNRGARELCLFQTTTTSFLHPPLAAWICRDLRKLKIVSVSWT